MGCISSKLIIARSISYHEERNQRSMRKANGIPLLEDLIISTSDQYLALVCTANKKSNKLHSKSLSSNTTSKLAIEPESSEVIDEKLESSTTLSEIQEGKEFENDHKNRSKSWHFPEHIVDSLSQENLSGFEDKDELRSKSDLGNRSFHTVEEYDDIVNRLWLNKSQIDQQSEFKNEDDDSEIKMDLQVSEFTSNITQHTQDEDSSIKKIQPTCLKKNEEVVPNHKTRILEKGNKRKAIANRLESLRVPSNVESPSIDSLREWLPADGIYSPGSYVTPKFGSYSSMNIRNANESCEDSIFSPELVSAFEQCMQKLEAEEENILKQILENVEEEIDEGMQN